MTTRKTRTARASVSANQLWGGRYAAGPAAVMTAINASIDVDKRLWREDIQGSLAHVAMLAAQGIVSAADAKKITRGLGRVAKVHPQMVHKLQLPVGGDLRVQRQFGIDRPPLDQRPARVVAHAPDDGGPDAGRPDHRMRFAA